MANETENKSHPVLVDPAEFCAKLTIAIMESPLVALPFIPAMVLAIAGMALYEGIVGEDKPADEEVWRKSMLDDSLELVKQYKIDEHQQAIDEIRGGGN